MSISSPAAARESRMDGLREELASACAQVSVGFARVVDVTARALADESWADAGIRSPEHWLVVRAGLSQGRACDVVRLARRRGELPSIVAALGDGVVTLDQAAVVARYAPASHERSVTELASNATVPQLRRALSRYAFAADLPSSVAADSSEAADAGAAADSCDACAAADSSDAGAAADPSLSPSLTGNGEGGELSELARAQAPPELSMRYDGGRLVLRYTAPAEVGALVEQAVKEAKDALFTSGQRDATYADGLAEVANRSLSGVEPTSRMSKYRVYVHVSTSGSWVNSGGGIPATVAAKLLCDGLFQPVWERDGRPVSVGRAQRVSPARTRRLIEDRDRGCRFPGCAATRFVEIHHLDHWAGQGETDFDRMVSLCPFHHDGHHRGEFTIEGDPGSPSDPGSPARRGSPGGLVFRNQWGLEIGYRPVHPRHVATASAATGLPPYAGPTGEHLRVRWVDFQPNPPPEPPGGHA